MFPGKDISLPNCSPLSWQGHLFNQTFTYSQKTRHESVSEPPAPLDMTIVCSAKVQKTSTSAPKLDLPLSPMTMGCWDAITIKATTTSLCTPPHPPWPLSTSPKILTLFFSTISRKYFLLCPVLLDLHSEEGSLNLNLFDELECEWAWVHVSMRVFAMYNDQNAFSFILQRPVWDIVDASQVKTPESL